MRFFFGSLENRAGINFFSLFFFDYSVNGFAGTAYDVILLLIEVFVNAVRSDRFSCYRKPME